MAKLTLNAIGSRYGSIDALNDNSDLVETAFENTLSRDGTGPNNMESDLDMDSNDIINVANLSVASLRVNGQPVSPGSINYTGQVKETQTATSGQTVFNLSTVSYAPLTNNLSVYVDGVYQNPTTYTENNSTRITFDAGVHIGAVVDFVVLSLTDLPGTTDASNVTYTPAGSGAVTTTVETKLRETVSVKDFGAVGNGTADDTAAIQNAINAAASQNKSLSFNGLMCKITSTVTIPSNLSIVETANGGVIHGAGALFTMFSGTSVSNVHIEGMVFDGNGANVTASGNIYARSPVISTGGTVSNIAVLGCTVHDCKGRGIAIAGNSSSDSKNVRVENNRIYDMSSTCIQCTDMSDVSIIGNNLENCVGAGIGITASAKICSNTIVSENIVKTVANDIANIASGLGITYFAISGYRVENNVVSNNVVSGCESMAYSLTAGSGGVDVPVNMVVTGNVAENTTAVGNGSGYSYETTGSNISVVGNISRNAAKVHIAIGGGSRLSIMNNHLESINSDTLLSGISVVDAGLPSSSTMDTISITGNVIVNKTGVAATTRCEAIYIVNITGSTIHKNISIQNNIITGDWRIGVYKACSSSSNGDISGNKITLSDVTNLGTGIQAYGNTLTIQDNVISPKSTGIGLNFLSAGSSSIVGILNNSIYIANIAGTGINFAVSGVSTIANVRIGGNIVATSSLPVTGRLIVNTLIDFNNNSWNYGGAVAPSTGDWTQGSTVFNRLPAVGSPKAWTCTVSGTPGTWVSQGNL